MAEVLQEGTVPMRSKHQGKLIGVLPPIYPEWLGSHDFISAFGGRFPYVVGEMARGISSAQMVASAAAAGMLAFFGSAGLRIDETDTAIGQIRAQLGPTARNWGVNLIHSPQDLAAEMAFAELAIKRHLSVVSASAFMRLSPAIVLLSAKGLKRRRDGTIERPLQLFAKISRAEVAKQFILPPPEAILCDLVGSGKLSTEEAQLAAQLSVAEQVTVEADSGGHTDNRPLTVLLPLIASMAHEISLTHKYATHPRIGAAGGLGTPVAIAAAFALGADYVVTGSINQCALESGLSTDARSLLAEAKATDIAMAPAADMFERGVKVQVLKRGTLFAQRAQRLYDLYRRYQNLDDIPAREREELESNLFGQPIEQIWINTVAHFSKANPTELERAEHDPHHKMALVFRWYLFMASEWARQGVIERRHDYQIWCGPVVGGFNQWVRGSFLELSEQRSVVQIGLNLLEGAAQITRAHQLRLAGVSVPSSAYDFRPRRMR
ncbi:MAG: PfaD family polyunsaturated fatty acid/polyketide biosynthesis protein [Candidatus Thiodiazotropha sp.]